MIEAARRLPEAEVLIRGEKYFMIHAARQSGKTTCLQDIVQRLNAEGKYYALYCTLEKLQGVKDAEKGIPVVLGCISNSLSMSGIPHAEEFTEYINRKGYTTSALEDLEVSIRVYCEKLDKPLVILFDEADCLSEGTLISFLRQLRAGYVERVSGKAFPLSIALVGMRNLRDYKARVRPEGETLGSASPFNIVTAVLTLENFTCAEVGELYGQHTADTGQVFEQGVVELVYEQTQGQPWLVNAIAREVIVEGLHNDYSQAVTCEGVRAAIQRIILSRPTHLDSLMERLREGRVRRVIEPVILGSEGVNSYDDDYLYVRDLGLIRRNADGTVVPSNAIYAEVIGRFLSSQAQESLIGEESPAQGFRFIKDGLIDMDFLLEEFRLFWRNNSDIWEERFDYKEAAPHLVLFAFLQRVINGGGQILREMGTGRRRVDLCVVYEGRRYPIELKVCGERDGLETVIERGRGQTARYMDTLGCQKGWLLVFDKQGGRSWEEKQFRREEKEGGKEIVVLGT
jgi:hypothetical protein